MDSSVEDSPYIRYFDPLPSAGAPTSQTKDEPTAATSAGSSDLDLGPEFSVYAKDTETKPSKNVRLVEAWVKDLGATAPTEPTGWEEGSKATAKGKSKARREEEEELNATINERIPAGRVFDHRDVMTTHANPAFHQPRRAPKDAISSYFALSKLEDDPDKWSGLPEVPSSAEVTGEKPDNGVPRNIIEEPWESKEAYLSSHYDLIREDTVFPLRVAVHQLRDAPTSKEDYFSGSVGVYDRVRIIGLTCNFHGGIAVRVAFSLARAGKRVHWEQSKRLIPGSMVALTPVNDMFQTKCVIATIAARPLDGLKQNPPEVDLYFARSEELEIDPAEEWVMVEERSSYFEASRHVMTALQKLSREGFPLQEHLVDIETEIQPPEYLKNNPFVNLSKAIDPTEEKSYENVDILNDWPVRAKTALDKSQVIALRAILSKRLAIIQGPPGTGKTHVSVVALRVMLDNWRPGDPPIIVSCQTNHALDQLLRHVAAFEENFVRLGGRSKDEDVVKRRTLYQLRQSGSVRPPKSGLFNTSRARMAVLSKEIEELLFPLALGSQALIDADALLKLKVLTAEQHQSLVMGDQDWVDTNRPQQDTAYVAAWLGPQLQIVPKNLQADEMYAFEEADLEFEQLQEIEAEATAQDDEDNEALKGQYIAIADNFTGKRLSRISNAQIETLLQTSDLYSIPAKHRGSVYWYMQRQVKQTILRSLRDQAKKFGAHSVQRRIGRFECDLPILRDQKLIGLTTTGLSKYRPLISALNPKIVLIEEAAEAIEAPVAVACVPSLQHLILVGDHQQLRPNCSVTALEGQPFNLNVSLFERMVLNNVGFSMLKRQRRMIPEIRRLLRPIYGESIVDHPLVKNSVHRPPVPGMGGVNSYFFTHEWPESRDENMSSCNHMEAEMIVSFYDYLILNGMKGNQITIITFYNGQRKALLRRLHRHPNLQGRVFKVVTVDSYQGEENEIILLSLVRSNDNYSIGFLNVDNRICVALSRARRGFYLFGNAELLCSAHSTWKEVIRIMRGKKGERAPDPIKRLDFHLPLTCDNHNRKTYIEEPEDFLKINGGCDVDCEGELPCGHPCELKCHPFEHSQVTCTKPCMRPMHCGHKCVAECCEPCRCAECEEENSNDALESMEPLLQALPAGRPPHSGSTPLGGTTALGGMTDVSEHDRQLYAEPHKTFDKWNAPHAQASREPFEALTTLERTSSTSYPTLASPPTTLKPSSISETMTQGGSEAPRKHHDMDGMFQEEDESDNTDDTIVERLRDNPTPRKVNTTEMNLIDFD
ncbi:hypothetical protein NA57DRAFT_63019 [Rhizodiscina lignyota]|uniref:P-loop containing nucleoside triphosphate hydrolase protein n=1 Tax=Rhizodiscina lignyota TaxID=1504668 RepID=A0A9P4IR28_9PEZI|nr:hypothetical protein NA57DRAFT_63019 [Rhizodiscina lignyota]